MGKNGEGRAVHVSNLSHLSGARAGSAVLQTSGHSTGGSAVDLAEGPNGAHGCTTGGRGATSKERNVEGMR